MELAGEIEEYDFQIEQLSLDQQDLIQRNYELKQLLAERQNQKQNPQPENNSQVATAVEEQPNVEGPANNDNEGQEVPAREANGSSNEKLAPATGAEGAEESAPANEAAEAEQPNSAGKAEEDKAPEAEA